VAGDPEGEGLARPGPPDHQGDADAALADIADHRLLIWASSRMGGQGTAYSLMGGDRRLFPHSAGGPTLVGAATHPWCIALLLK
jgi:hypothetical protein